jgi:hypothetical protein
MEGKPIQLASNCETVLFEPDENRMTMTWRAELPCDKKMLKIEEIRCSLGRLEGVERN